ncbi:MAG TPA: YqiA/YcfP family alpha/beta fold hydrolase [Bryobacteraceae bacterium]|nr:YqiA/YcfP family alpha/beta fold hydrolase [Bryobacteraceae bacterium]
MRYIYLHGFASGPQSRKAQAFRAALAACEIDLEIPILDETDFAHLTLSGQLQVIQKTLSGAPCRLIGSSMGGYLASLYAAAHPEVDRLVLLAPAFAFQSRWREIHGQPAIDRWRQTGWLPVYHYGAKEIRQVHFGLYEDAGLFPAYPDFGQPARIFHGINDTVVPIGFSRTFAATHLNAQLTELDSDHELTDALEVIVRAAIPFLTE